MSVVFGTKAWGGDYLKFLSGAFQRKEASIGFPFTSRMLVTNNGVPEEIFFPVQEPFEQFRTEGWKKQVLGFLELDEANVYASGELTAVYLNRENDYLCYVQGDCLTSGGDWVTPAIAVLESEPDVLLVSPLSEVNTRGEYDQYCSDQAFVARLADLARPEVYSYRETDPDYPAYGGLSFEHLVGNYMKATGKRRKVLSEFWCHHPQY